MIKQKIRFYTERFKALTMLEKTAVAATAALLLTILGVWLSNRPISEPNAWSESCVSCRPIYDGIIKIVPIFGG